MSYYSSIHPSPSPGMEDGANIATKGTADVDNGHHQQHHNQRHHSTPPAGHDRSDELDLDHVVSEGSFGRIFRARYKATGAIVAVKIAPLIDTVRNEIHYLSKCNCPYVVAYFGSFVSGSNKMWVITDYCGGGFVSELFNEKRGEGIAIPEECVRAVCAGTVLGLEYLHGMHVCHRDIRASSILLTNSGCVKVTSFGLSAELDEVTKKRKSVVGSSLFMPPEVIKESDYDGKRDVWSLGVATIEMAEGAPPHASLEPGAIIAAIISNPAPRLADSDKWSGEMARFVEACCKKGPGDRIDSKSLTEHPFVKEECAKGRTGTPLFPWRLIQGPMQGREASDATSKPH